MKISLKWLLFGCLFLASFSLFAQQKVNEPCTGDDNCESGYCLETKYGSLCGTCPQSKLKTLSATVYSTCKESSRSWKKAREYTDRIASDDRVADEVFPMLLERINDCKEARLAVMEVCFKGGGNRDPGKHRQSVEEVGNNFENLKKEYKKSVADRQVYYCSKSTYESALRNYTRYCNLRFSSIEDDIEDALDDLEDDKEIDCDDIEDYYDDCKACYEAADDLLDNGFKGNNNFFPKEYKKVLDNAEEQMEAAEAVMDLAKKEKLCD